MHTTLMTTLVISGMVAALPSLRPRGDGSTLHQDPPWYRDSAAAVAEALPKRGDASTLHEDPPWYRDSAAAVSEALSKRGDDSTLHQDPPWYRDSAAAVSEALAKREDDSTLYQDPPWYRDSAAAVSEALAKREDASTLHQDPPWYRDSAAAVSEALSKRGDDSTLHQDPPWYRDSAAAVSEALTKREEDSTLHQDPPWYRDSAAAVAEGVNAKFGERVASKMEEIRHNAFSNKRRESMRVSSEKGKAFFLFHPHPRNDSVDRWHVPTVIALRYAQSDSDADRVSLLNNYLYVTGRQPKPASKLGFTPTMAMPGLPEGGNEVGYGYALDGQHQYHCADVVADAIDIGKDKTSDFFLEHVIHCLALIKTMSMKLTDPQPVSLLSAYGESQVKGGFSKTRE